MPSASVHTLVHIGAGNGCQFSKLTSNAAPVRTVLIEPLPSHADGLRRNHPNTEVWELAISCQHNNQPATLTEFNLSEASSLHQPSGLLQLYPGIKAVRQHQVQTQTPAAMMAKLQLPEGEQHKLVIEANGEEAAIVQTLAQAVLLQQFKQVQVALPTTALYDSEHHAEQLSQQLQACHFELAEEKTDDPDTHIQVWVFNAQSCQLAKQLEENAKLKAKTADMQQKLDKQTRQSQQLAQQRETLLARQNDQEKQITELNTQLEQEQNQHGAASRHAETLNNQQAELNARLAATEQTLADTKTQLATSQEELTKYKNDVANYKKQHEAAEQHIAELSQQLADAHSSMAAQQEQLQQKLNEQNRQSQQLAQQRDELLAHQNEQERQVANLQKQKTELQQLLQSETQAREKAQQQLKAVTTDLEQLKQEKEQLAKDNNVLKEQERRLLELQKKHADLQQKNQKLLNEHQATQSRQQLLESELLKAEAQIELIKELMLNSSTI